jgi:hypothetical protein
MHEYAKAVPADMARTSSAIVTVATNRLNDPPPVGYRSTI